MVWILPNVFTISSTGFFSQSGCMPLNFGGIFLTSLAFLFHPGGGVRILTRTNLNQLMDQSFTDQNQIKQRETSTRDNCSSKGEKRFVSFTVKFLVRQIRSTMSILALRSAFTAVWRHPRTTWGKFYQHQFLLANHHKMP